MSTKKKTGSRKEPAAAVGSKSQLLLALKDQVVQLQQQLQAEQEEREKISSWLANTLKPNLKSKFGEYREEIDGHSNQIERILQYLKDNRGANSGEQSVSREEFEELKRELAIERESRVQLNIWLKKSFGKNLELLDARISEKSNGSAGTPTTMTKSSTTSVLPESVPEWLRMIGYERYIGEFQRAKCNDVKKLVRLTDDHLVKLGIALKRHRDDILYSVDELKEKLEAPTPKTPSTPIVHDILSDSDVDPFSESEIEAKVSEQQAEKDKLIEMEKRRMQQQFEEEKRLWMEKERERIREEVERTERERMRQEEEKLTKKLAKERKLIEEQQKEIAQKELETKKLLQQQRDEEKKTREAEKRLRLEMERKERLETERKERERKEQEEWSRREREDRDRNEQKNAKHTEPEEDTLSEPKETETPAPEKVVEKTEVKATTVDKRASGGAKKQTATTEDPETGKSFKELLDEVRDDTCKTNWVAFYFDKASNSIKLTNYGSGGHEDLMNHLDDDKVQYAMLRVVDPKRRVKFIYIHWVGQKAHAFLKARSGTKKAEMLELMGQFHIEMPAETKDDVSKQAILTKLKAAVNF